MDECCWWNGRSDEVDALLARHGYTTMVSELQHSLKEADRIGEIGVRLLVSTPSEAESSTYHHSLAKTI